MNKKMLAAVGISGALLLGSVYSISANTSGYDLYKGALKQTHQAESATVGLKMNVEDNDKTIFSSDTIFKSDTVQNVSSIKTNLANETESRQTSLYKQDGSWYVMSDHVDTIYQMDPTQQPHHTNTAELQDDVENLIDVMTKNLQQQITVDEKQNGNHLIQLDLTGKEIPLTANALGTLMIKHAVMIQDSTQDKDGSDFHMDVKVPELDHDITFEQIQVIAEVNEKNIIKNQTVAAILTGKDKQGTNHKLDVELEINVTDYNGTTVTPIDIPTEKVVKFDHSTVGK